MRPFFVLFAVLLIDHFVAIIPLPCVTDGKVNRMCCPAPEKQLGFSAGPCGSNMNRGECRPTGLALNTTETDVRKNWPGQYFSHTCKCGERYGGYDCGECSFAYNDGGDCINKTVLPRKSLSSMSDEDWKYYRQALRKIKDERSRYAVAKTLPSVANDTLNVTGLVNPTTYNLFVWLHHFVAKDNDATIGDPDFTDYAHEGTGFPTWHRLFLLWLEREIQVAISNHTFRLPFWDWSDYSQRDVPFCKDRLGKNIDGYVEGELFNDWKMYCWILNNTDPNFRDICDPTTPSVDKSQLVYFTTPKKQLRLRRCPNRRLCHKANPIWPSKDDVEHAVSIGPYDHSPYNRSVRGTTESFRNFMEGFVVQDQCKKGDTLCSGVENKDQVPKVTRKLHNTVHIILGLGGITNAAENPGVMSCVAASPNDPIFINHHANIDCILEKWLQKNNNSMYPVSDEIREGHRINDNLVPFMPLYTHEDMFKTADNFGYTCSAISAQGVIATILAGLVLVATLVII